MTSTSKDEQAAHAAGGSEPDLKSKRFRFKRKRSHQQDSTRSRHGADSHRHHHRSKRRRASPQGIDDPTGYDNSTSRLPSDTAFRESLFDALGDDEGAAFWEGVYGQPIHNYSDHYQDPRTGELEQMDDDQYAQYVRRKMWEKSWEGIEAAKEEQRKEREHEKQRIRNDEKTHTHRGSSKRETDYLFDLDIEQSLRRGERRKDQKRYKALWDEYLQLWGELQTLRELSQKGEDTEQLFLRNKIAWPVETGKRKDVNAEEIERFMRNCARATDGDDETLVKAVKSERIRWHPDKIQQRYGFMSIDETTMQGVTAVFQALDRMWNDLRSQE